MLTDPKILPSMVLKEYPTSTGWTLIIAGPDEKVQGRSPNS